MGFKTVAIASLIAGTGNAFTVPSTRLQKRCAFATGLKMAEGGPPNLPKTPDLVIKSGLKEIGYDEKTGRFSEIRVDEECVPEDEYCVIDDKSGKPIRLTIEEKERIFLDALQSYYVSGRQLLSDEEFDLLKADLQWNGSAVGVLNRKEAKYLAAMQGYLKGEPILSDEEFDSLKKELKEDGSQFAVSTEPKCYIDTGICTVTLQEDSFRNNLLYLPVGALLTLAWIGFGFEVIEKFIRINPLILLGLGSPLIIQYTKSLTDGFIFPNNKIVYGPCPACEAEQRVYFGDILGVEGFGEVAEAKCKNCKTVFRVQRNTLRASTLPKSS